MNQQALQLPDATPLARNSDPDTSHQAAASIEVQVAGLQMTCLLAIYGSVAGLTSDELAEATGIDRVTVSPRLRPLADKGLLYDAGRRKGKSGRPSIVWKATETGALLVENTTGEQK